MLFLFRPVFRMGAAMKKIVLISCVSLKLPHKARVEDLYTSTLFKLNLKYAKKLKPDAIFILSAKHGLLDLAVEIAPYDVTLNEMHTAERKVWAKAVLEQLGKRTNLQSDHFIFLAGQNYRKYVAPSLASFEVPLEGLPIGKQLQKLKGLTA